MCEGARFFFSLISARANTGPWQPCLPSRVVRAAQLGVCRRRRPAGGFSFFKADWNLARLLVSDRCGRYPGSGLILIFLRVSAVNLTAVNLIALSASRGLSVSPVLLIVATWRSSSSNADSKMLSRAVRRNARDKSGESWNPTLGECRLDNSGTRHSPGRPTTDEIRHPFDRAASNERNASLQRR